MSMLCVFSSVVCVDSIFLLVIDGLWFSSAYICLLGPQPSINKMINTISIDIQSLLNDKINIVYTCNLKQIPVLYSN